MKNYFGMNYAVLAGFILMTAVCSFAQVALQTETKIIGGIATLYALDPLAHSLCFGDGREGGVFQKNEARNRCSDINFDNYDENGLTVGIEGGRVGAIVDLGSAGELEKRYGYSDTLGKGQGFASLRLENGKILILKDRKTHSEQDLIESPMLFSNNAKQATAPVKLGHIYLIRLTDRNEKTFERVVKIIVLAYTPNESVTIRWQAM